MELGQRALWRVTDGLRLGGHGSARTSCVCWKGGFGFKPRKAALEGKDYHRHPGRMVERGAEPGLGAARSPHPQAGSLEQSPPAPCSSTQHPCLSEMGLSRERLCQGHPGMQMVQDGEGQT